MIIQKQNKGVLPYKRLLAMIRSTICIDGKLLTSTLSHSYRTCTSMWPENQIQIKTEISWFVSEIKFLPAPPHLPSRLLSHKCRSCCRPEYTSLFKISRPDKICFQTFTSRLYHSKYNFLLQRRLLIVKVAINQLFISDDALFYSLSSPSLQALLIIFLIIIMIIIIIIMIIFIAIMLGIITSVHKLLGVSVVNISVEFPQLVSPGDCDDDLIIWWWWFWFWFWWWLYSHNLSLLMMILIILMMMW